MLNKNKFDIISISHFFYPRVGGLENMAYGAIKYLSSKGFKSIAIYGNSENIRFQSEGFTWKSFKCIKLFNKTYPIFGLNFFLYIFNIIGKNPEATVMIYDRHLVSSLLSSIVCKLLNHPYIIVSQTTDSNYFKNKVFQSIGSFLDNTVFKWVIKGANKIIAVSDYNKRFLSNKFEIAEDKFQTIYNGFNEKTINEVKNVEKKKIIVFSTKFIPVKDPDTAAKAFLILAEKFKEWKFIFAGSGNCILNEYSELPSNLEFIPRFIPQGDLFELLAESTIYVNSSLNEGLSLGVIEAAGLGNIPVLSDADSNIEVASILKSKDFIFKKTDFKDLISKISSAIKYVEENLKIDAKLELNKSISENAFKKFSSVKVFNKYFKFIKDYQKSLINNSIEKGQNINKLYFKLSR